MRMTGMVTPPTSGRISMTHSQGHPNFTVAPLEQSKGDARRLAALPALMRPGTHLKFATEDAQLSPLIAQINEINPPPLVTWKKRWESSVFFSLANGRAGGRTTSFSISNLPCGGLAISVLPDAEDGRSTGLSGGYTHFVLSLKAFCPPAAINSPLLKTGSSVSSPRLSHLALQLAKVEQKGFYEFFNVRNNCWSIYLGICSSSLVLSRSSSGLDPAALTFASNPSSLWWTLTYSIPRPVSSEIGPVLPAQSLCGELAPPDHLGLGPTNGLGSASLKLDFGGVLLFTAESPTPFGASPFATDITIPASAMTKTTNSPCVPMDPPRSSARLHNLTKDSMLGKAMSKKTCLLEGRTTRSGTSGRKLTSKKVKKKSLLCEVKLYDTEAKELHKFLCAEA